MKVSTPGGDISLSDAREAPAGSIYSFDGTRLIPEDSVAAALELSLYSYRAFVTAEAFHARWARVRQVAESSLTPSREQLAMVIQPLLQALYALRTCLRIQADMYAARGMSTRERHPMLADINASWEAYWDGSVSPPRLVRTFTVPGDWVAWADDMVTQYQAEAQKLGYIEVDGPMVPPRLGAPVVVVWVVVTLVTLTTAALLTRYQMNRSRALDLEARRLEMLQQRYGCMDRAIEDYRRTGDPAYLDILRDCSRTAELLKPAVEGSPLTAGLSLLSAIAAGAAVWMLYKESRGSR